MNKRLALSLALSLLTALGCASPADDSGVAPNSVGPGGQGGAGAAPTPMVHCRRYAAALCAKEAQCDPTGLRVFYGDEAACARSTTDACLVVSAAPDVAWTAEAHA